MITTKVLSIVFPVFFLIGLGYLFGRIKKIDLGTLTEIIIYVASPALAFSALSKRDLPLEMIGFIPVAVLFIILGMWLLSAIFLRFHKEDLRGLHLPIIFPNAGNMNLPLCLFAFGEEGLALAVIFFTTNVIIHYTLGIAIVSRGADNASEALRMPMIYAAIAGIIVSLMGWEVPLVIQRPLEMLGTAGIGFMLFTLGYRLVTVRIQGLNKAIAAAIIRIFGGFILSWLVTTLLGMKGIPQAIIILGFSMPSAVINFIFAQKFNKNPEMVASVVWVSTVLSLITTPIVLSFLL